MDIRLYKKPAFNDSNYTRTAPLWRIIMMLACVYYSVDHRVVVNFVSAWILGPDDVNNRYRIHLKFYIIVAKALIVH